MMLKHSEQPGVLGEDGWEGEGEGEGDGPVRLGYCILYAPQQCCSGVADSDA